MLSAAMLTANAQGNNAPVSSYSGPYDASHNGYVFPPASLPSTPVGFNSGAAYNAHTPRVSRHALIPCVVCDDSSRLVSSELAVFE